MPFNDSLKNLREGKQLTQAELAKRTGLTVSAISMYENGKREPKFEILELLADFFNVNMDILLGRAPLPAAEEPPPNADLLLERELLESYRRCKEPRRANIREYAEDQAARQEEDDIKEAQARFIKKKEIS